MMKTKKLAVEGSLLDLPIQILPWEKVVDVTAIGGYLIPFGIDTTCIALHYVFNGEVVWLSARLSARHSPRTPRLKMPKTC